MAAECNNIKNRAGILSSTLPGTLELNHIAPKVSGCLDEALAKFSKPSYYKELENGGFDTGELDDYGEKEEEQNQILHIEDTWPKPPEGSIKC